MNLKPIIGFVLLLFVACMGPTRVKPQAVKLTIEDSLKPKGVSFDVDSVQQPKGQLLTYDAKLVFENKIGKALIYIPQEQQYLQLAEAYNNGLVQTIHVCYDQHRPLLLSPDIIWLAICQGVAMHVNFNFNQLKYRIFTVKDRKTLIVQNDSLAIDAKHWQEVIAGLANQTKEYTKDDIYSLLIPKYTTTTTIETVAFQNTLLDAFKKEFNYVALTGCGIPQITITGTEQDWQTIYNRLNELDKVGLGDWGNELKPVIKQFINAVNNKPNQDFWKNIYKNEELYGGTVISGWILKFFPYLKGMRIVPSADSSDALMYEDSIYPNPYLKGYRFLLSRVEMDNIPSGLSKVPVKWINQNNNTVTDIVVTSGFMATRQFKDNTLMPLISWVVYEEKAAEVHHEFKYKEQEMLKHRYTITTLPQDDKWLSPPLYQPESYPTEAIGKAELTKLIERKLIEWKCVDANPSIPISLSFVVLTNGTIDQVEINGIASNKEAAIKLHNLLNDNSIKWKAASKKAKDIVSMEEMEIGQSASDEIVLVNSTMSLALFKK